MRILALVITFTFYYNTLPAQPIPLPEHPRPDFHRDQWQNLNGKWSFAFDSTDMDIDKGWYNATHAFDHHITVPFPWGSALSGVEDQADIGWYRRSIIIDDDYSSPCAQSSAADKLPQKRVFRLRMTRLMRI